MYYELDNGCELYFDTFGGALEYCFTHDCKIIRITGA